MKLFLLVYDRKLQKLVSVQQFAEDARAAADTARLKEQRLALQNDLDREIVLFEAKSLAALKRTHESYFSTPRVMAKRATPHQAHIAMAKRQRRLTSA